MDNKNPINVILYIGVATISAMLAISIKGYYVSVSMYPSHYLSGYLNVATGVFGLLGFIILASAALVMIPSCYFFVRYLKNLTDLHRYRRMHELELDTERHINIIHQVRNERFLPIEHLTVEQPPVTIDKVTENIEADVYDTTEAEVDLEAQHYDYSQEIELDVIYDSINNSSPPNPYLGVTGLTKKDDKGYQTNLLEEMLDCKRVLIIGSQGSGKTTLFQHLIKQKLEQGHSVVVMDSHNTPGKWDSRVRVVGHGRDYAAIENELENSLALMNHRYEQLGSGEVLEGDFPQVYFFSDEWTTVSKNVNDLPTYLLPLLTEGRKVGINFILSTHSKTAASIGIKGSYDLIQNFEFVLQLQNDKGTRYIEMATSANPKGKELYAHPGEYKS